MASAPNTMTGAQYGGFLAVGMGISAATGAASSILSGMANADIADYNAKVAQAMAVDAKNRGEEAVAMQRESTKLLIGQQRAAYAAQNVSVSTGTALDVQADTVRQSEIDVGRIRANAIREAFGFTTQAGLSRMEGQMAMGRGIAGAGATLLTGASNAALTYYSLKDK